MTNGQLLDLAEVDGYELLITTDQSMRYQQNLTDRPFGVLVLMATAWPNVRQRIETIRSAIEAAVPHA